MLILGVNKVLHWVQITAGWGRYTCPTKMIDGKLFSQFKKEWHLVSDYLSEHTHELVEEGGKIIRSHQQSCFKGRWWLWFC